MRGHKPPPQLLLAHILGEQVDETHWKFLGAKPIGKKTLHFIEHCPAEMTLKKLS